ncbi:MAG: GAF domain-containing protein [Spirochaetales bacterium]|nr:GAF domain-containing protein [Spirochaetales bacterium]
MSEGETPASATQQALDNQQRENEKLNRLLEAATSIMSEMDLTSLLTLLIEKTSEVLDAERATLFLIDKRRDELYSRVFKGDEVEEIRFSIDQGIAGVVARTGETLNIADAYEDERFNPEIDRRTGYQTHNLLTMAIKNGAGVIIGVIQVLNKIGKDRFDEEDIELLRALSSLIAISLENALNFGRVHDTLKAFELFVPRKYLERVSRDGIENIRLGYTARASATVLFLDIRSFTSLAEDMNPEGVSRFLNSYFADMNAIVSRHGGVIDKFIGDGFMAMFDTGETDGAVLAALDITLHLEDFNARRAAEGQAEIRIGMGVSSGDVTIGTIGSLDRMDTTAIGDAVVIAKRIETLTKLYNVPLLISHSTVYGLRDADRFHIREIDSITVKGKTRPEVIYEVYDNDPQERFAKKEASHAHLLQGISYYKLGEWDMAINRLSHAVEMFPEDTVAAIYLERCLFLKRNPPAEDWNGTVTAEWQAGIMGYAG